MSNNNTFATFETPGFAAGVEAAAKCAEDHRLKLSVDTDFTNLPGTIATAIRNLTPAPPADLCAKSEHKSDASEGLDTNALVEKAARALVEPLGYPKEGVNSWESIWVGGNTDSPETGSLAHLCRSLARAALSAIPAADAIAALSAENAGLREALEQAATWLDGYDSTVGDFARAALTKQPD